MAFKNLIAFGAGEITPELYERGNLDKFRTGLKTLRNCFVTKMGGIKSRAGTIKLHNTKDNDKSKFLYIRSKQYLLEFTYQNVRIYENFDPIYNTFLIYTDIDLALYPVADDVTKLHFTHGNRYVYVFSDGIGPIKIDLEATGFPVTDAVSLIQESIIPPDPFTDAILSFDVQAGYLAPDVAPTGYKVHHIITFVKDGVETLPSYPFLSLLKPVNTNECNYFTFTIDKTLLPTGISRPDEIRVYQRPYFLPYFTSSVGAGQFGYIGTAPVISENTSLANYYFKDYGAIPDFTNNPPEITTLGNKDFRQDGGIALSEIFDITFNNPATYYNILGQGKKIQLSGNDFVWFRVTDGVLQIAPSGIGTAHQISILLADTTAQVATKATTVIDALSATISAVALTSTKTRVTYYAGRKMPTASKQTSNVTIKLIQKGAEEGTPSYPITPKTGLVYQDRLVFSGTKSKKCVHGSRVGIEAMTRDFPLQSDSAVGFVTGSDGGLEVNRFFDGRGLLIFTSVGVYETPTVQLTPDTAYSIKRGPYVAEESIEPIQLGGSVTIYDKRLKAVIGIAPAGNYDGYGYTEYSIYSNHLLKGKKIVSWALQDDQTQILWMVLDDGTVLSFSYQDEQLVRSWARHDFQDGLVEEVFIMKLSDGNDVACFCVNYDGDRIVQRLADRDAEFLDYVATDSTVIYKENIMVSAVVLTAVVAPVTPTVWDGPLTITGSGAFGSIVGDIIRYYISDYKYIDLEVTDNTLGVLTVTPSLEFPSASANITLEQGLWTTYNVLTGLSHLEGKKVSVRIDGFTHASPLNTERGYEEYTVTGGQITLVDDARGAVISVGLPVVNDIETLEVDTVEQYPTKLESKIVNKLWLSYFESLFLYAAAVYPDDDTVTGMENQEYQVELDTGILSTQPTLPQSERIEMQIQGDWKAQGTVALRNVDPQPIALRAIIPDTEVIRN